MSQVNDILKHLKIGLPLTPMEALYLFQIMRLGARIKELRDRGHMISTTMIKLMNGKRVAEYRLEESR